MVLFGLLISNIVVTWSDFYGIPEWESGKRRIGVNECECLDNAA